MISINKVPHTDVLLLLGDFNARVGYDDEEWRGILGKYGLDSRNEAGETLLEFCATNELVLMNTCFAKKAKHLATWRHPATKAPHMIDYILMRSWQRVVCTDVQVMRGASCWTDHHLVRVKLRLGLAQQNRCTSNQPFAVHLFSRREKKEAYSDTMSKLLHDNPHCHKSPAEHNWQTLKVCITTAAKNIVGYGERKDPDWFAEAKDFLLLLVEAKQSAYHQYLQDNTSTSKKNFRSHQRRVKLAVAKAKAKRNNEKGHQRWQSVRQLQMAFAGRRPVRSSTIVKEDGELTSNPEEMSQRWHEHFSKILNISSQVNQEAIETAPFHQPMHDLDDLPTEEELLAALGNLKKGKAGGRTGIMPELILYGREDLHERLLKLIQDVWRERAVVGDWRHAEIVLIPKKGDLKLCDNWRGISLLDVVGKIMARIVQERLSAIAEQLLPESQCGFRKGRGCTDMIFTARQLIEKSREHAGKLFILFVDLKKGL